MRRVLVVLLALLAIPATTSSSPAQRASDLHSRDALLGWMWSYRAKPDPASVPAAMRAASRIGLFQNTENAGVFVGFMAGVIAANPKAAKGIIEKTLPLPTEDQWFMVRAIAYSGAPQWRALLRDVADKLPARRVMIDKHVADELPTLEHLDLKDDPKWYAKAWETIRIDRYFRAPPPKEHRLEPSPDLIDTLWGYHLATGAYAPVARLISILPWVKDRDNADRLALGAMAKYTLALNASRSPQILDLLRWAVTQRHRDGAVPQLKEVIDAAETADTVRLRREALAAIEDLKRRGPYYRRNVAWWGQMGESAIALGCLGAAITGQVQFGLPCVLGGALTSAGLRWWATQE